MAHRTHPTPISEQRRLVANWRHSNLSIGRFADSVGVAQSTFWRWTRKYAETAVVPTMPEFIEVTEAPAPVAVQLRVQGSRAVLLTFDALPDATWLGTVVKEVTTC